MSLFIISTTWKKKLQQTSKQNNVCQQKDDFAKHADTMYYIPRKTAFTVLHFEIIIVSVASFWLTFFVLENLISIAMTSLSGMVHVHGTILTVILKKLDKVVSMDECTLHAVVLYYPKLLSILILKYAFVLFRFWFLRISFVLLYFVLFCFLSISFWSFIYSLRWHFFLIFFSVACLFFFIAY